MPLFHNSGLSSVTTPQTIKICFSDLLPELLLKLLPFCLGSYFAYTFLYGASVC